MFGWFVIVLWVCFFRSWGVSGARIIFARLASFALCVRVVLDFLVLRGLIHLVECLHVCS